MVLSNIQHNIIIYIIQLNDEYKTDFETIGTKIG